jgi:hypothetical protein
MDVAQNPHFENFNLKANFCGRVRKRSLCQKNKKQTTRGLNRRPSGW